MSGGYKLLRRDFFWGGILKIIARVGFEPTTFGL